MAATIGPWQPFEPIVEDPWNLDKVAHLHRRAGFGANWAELQRDLKAGPATSVARLLRPRQPSAEETEVVAALLHGALVSDDVQRAKAWWLYRVLYDPDPVREKRTLFWHNYFATSNRKVKSLRFMLEQNDLFRRLADGEVAALLDGITRDKAMLIWLDGGQSSKEKPNENYAREFLELFTLGAGHYSEADVRAASRAFTGWRHKPAEDNRADDTLTFDASRFDDGVKTFLGRTGPWKPADIVRMALEQPAAAEFLCRKLYRFYVSENGEPGPALIQPLAEELRRSRYAIGHVLGIILRSRHFYSRDVRRQRIKSPVEFSAGMVRMLDVPRADVRLLALAGTCERQGQDLFYPPNVKGWETGRAWLTSSTLVERGNWVSDIVWGNPNFGVPPFDPAAWARRNGISPARALPSLIELLLQNDVPTEVKELILRASPDGQADGLRERLQLILRCPEFQLA